MNQESRKSQPERVRVCVALALILIVGTGRATAQGPAREDKIQVYNHIFGAPTALDREAKEPYKGKYRFLDVRTSDGFVSARPRWGTPHYRDPRPGWEKSVFGKVTIAFIVTREGNMIEPQVIRSTDKRLNAQARAAIPRIYHPARFRGAPVYSLLANEILFGSERQDKGPRNGLGIQGYRDR